MENKKNVPSEWRKCKLADVCELIDGDRSSNYPSPNEIVEKGILFLSTSNIKSDKFVFDNCRFISEEKFISLNKGKLTKGDIVITLRGTIGSVAKFTGDIFDTAFINAQMLIIRSKNVDSNYLYNYLKYDNTKNRLLNISSGSAQKQLTKKDLESFSIINPPLKEQEKIAEILSNWDLAIEKQEKLIEKKKELKKGLMQRLLSGEVRFSKDNGESFPEWRKVKLGEYLIKHNEKSEFNNQYPVLTSSRKGIFLQSDYYAGNDVASDDTTGYNVVPRGYFTYRHMSDDLIFKFNINDIVDKGIVSTLYPVFTVKNMDSYFLRTKLNEGNEFKRFALAQKQGGSRTYMYFSKLESLKMDIPSLEEQEKISEVLKLADKEIELLEKQLEALKLQKKGLMQRLLTGEVRVKV